MVAAVVELGGDGRVADGRGSWSVPARRSPQRLPALEARARRARRSGRPSRARSQPARPGGRSRRSTTSAATAAYRREAALVARPSRARGRLDALTAATTSPAHRSTVRSATSRSRPTAAAPADRRPARRPRPDRDEGRLRRGRLRRVHRPARRGAGLRVPRARWASWPGGDVATVEGLARRRSARGPLQAAFLACGAAQCGICTPGMLMAADDLLAPDARTRRRREVLDGARRRALPMHRLSQDRRGVLAAGGAARCRPRPAADTPRHAGQAGRRRGSRRARRRRPPGHGREPCSGRRGAGRRPRSCARCVRRTPTRGSRSATWRRSTRAHPGLVRVLVAADVPGQNRYGIYADGQGPAGPRRRVRAVSRRGGRSRSSATRRPSPRIARRRAARSPGTVCRRCSASTAAPSPTGRRGSTRASPGNMLDRGAGRARRRRSPRSAASAVDGDRARSRRPTSSTPTSSPRPATARRVGGPGRGLSRRPRRRTWTATSSR